MKHTIFGFIYEWTDLSTGLKYIGKHEGNPDDGYIGSGTIFKKEYNNRPKDFVRTILWESQNTTIDELTQQESLILENISEDELYFGRNRKYYNIVKNSTGYTSENNPMKNPQMVKQMLETRKKKGTHKNLWERLVEKYGYEEACNINKRKMEGNKNGRGNKGKSKTEDHKKKISEKIKKLAQDPNSTIGKNSGRKPAMDRSLLISTVEENGLKNAALKLGLSYSKCRDRYYRARNKLKVS